MDENDWTHYPPDKWFQFSPQKKEYPVFELSSWEMYYAPKILAAEQTCYWEGHVMNEISEWFLRFDGTVYS